MAKITVQALRNNVPIDGLRTFGAAVEVERTEHVDHLIAAGHIAIVDAPKKGKAADAPTEPPAV